MQLIRAVLLPGGTGGHSVFVDRTDRCLGTGSGRLRKAQVIIGAEVETFGFGARVSEMVFYVLVGSVGTNKKLIKQKMVLLASLQIIGHVFRS